MFVAHPLCDHVAAIAQLPSIPAEGPNHVGQCARAMQPIEVDEERLLASEPLAIISSHDCRHTKELTQSREVSAFESKVGAKVPFRPTRRGDHLALILKLVLDAALAFQAPVAQSVHRELLVEILVVLPPALIVFKEAVSAALRIVRESWAARLGSHCAQEKQYRAHPCSEARSLPLFDSSVRHVIPVQIPM